MTNNIIKQLTPEQKALIPVYQEKWRKIILSTEPIDRVKAAEVIKTVYDIIDEPTPKILFFDSPYGLAKDLGENYYDYKGTSNEKQTKIDWERLASHIKAWEKRLEQIFNVPYEVQTDLQIKNIVTEIELISEIEIESTLKEIGQSFVSDEFSTNTLGTDYLYSECGWYDFCISELKLENYYIIGQLCLEIHKYCGRLFAYPEFCLVYDRPCQLSFDDRGYLHAEGKPAIQYADGFCVYAFHGERIPKKYGLLPSNQWKTEWLLSEKDAKIRRFLIQNIGYKKISQELKEKELEQLQEHTFLEISPNLNVELVPFIKKVTPEQQSLMQVHREKWRKILLCTERINRKKATEAVKAAYKLMGEAEPTVRFFDSPYKMSKQLFKSLKYKEDSNINWRVFINQITEWKRRLEDFCEAPHELQQDEEMETCIREIRTAVDLEIEGQLSQSLGDILCSQAFRMVIPYYGSLYGWLDFCVSELKFQISSLAKNCQALQEHCGGAYALPEVCLVYDRPCKLSFDTQGHLHAEGEPAIQYTDGFCVYAYRGVRIPEQYGKVLPKDWKSEWLLSETNAEIRRVLIQGIGYERICQQLQAVEIDTWKEYTLLKIELEVDVEPVYLLKMICPSTGRIHALRVPPDMTSARTAICWVNWDIDPEEFATQT